jgi:glutamate--cysteine ligase catalytic subunit
MARAQTRDAAIKSKFHFRKNIYNGTNPCDPKSCKQLNEKNEDQKTECSMTAQMTINEIFNGSDNFTGLITLVEEYLNSLDIDVDTQCSIKQYLKLIKMRASGKLMTTAAWMRKFVTSHPKYNHDSIVTPEMNYDLMWRIHLISSGQIKCPELFFPFGTKSK